jgi:SOS-response transcriptional repressor LexA
MRFLTQRQCDIILFILNHHRSEGILPSLPMIKEHFDMLSDRVVRTHLNILKAKGYLPEMAYYEMTLTQTCT